MNLRAAAILCVLAVAASGCLRGDATEAGANARENGAAPATPTLGSVAPSVTVDLGDDFAAHHHDYWGPRTEVTVFDGPVTLDTFPLDGLTYEGCNAVGHAQFDFEDDGEDSAPGAPPVNPDTGRADVIFPGTSTIRVQIDWADTDAAAGQSVAGLALRYRPANQQLPQSETVEDLRGSACGAVVPKGSPFHVPVKPLQFDPAHQTSLSRWSFELWSYTSSQGNAPAQTPSVSIGAVHVRMAAVFGGETFLDPPHPDFFGDADVLALGTAAGHVDLSVVAEPSLPEGLPRVVSSPLGYRTFPGLSDITFPRGNIAPLGMERIEVEACLIYTGPLPAGLATFGLAYHGADRPEFLPLEPVSQDGDCSLYRIDDPQGLKADSPYETVSQWAFRIVPTVQDMRDHGWFEGEYAFTFTAYRNVT